MVVVEIENGKLSGKIGTDRNGRKFYSFQNIPYAAPPIGNLRFKAPRPVESWTGIKDATKEGNESVSYHMLTKKVVGSEDCLNLNVYTPEVPKDNKPKSLKPVMFWIHGGLCVTGSNKSEIFGPEFLMTEDVVLVTPNYRLGVLGFLSLDNPSLGVPGNAAFKDLVMALKWVQKNIINFSGDPNNVTVFGGSSGAAAAHLLMLSPMTKGLLHKVIAQSGCALNMYVMGRRASTLIAKELGFTNSDDKERLHFLQSVRAQRLLQAQTKLDAMDLVENENRLFGLVVEKPSDEEPFLTENPFVIILTGNYNQVPLIVGYNFREGMALDDLLPPRVSKAFFTNAELWVPLSLNVPRGSSVSKTIAEKIQHFYYGDVQPDRKEHAIQYYDLWSDTLYLRDTYFSVKNHMNTLTKPIYFYRMSLETQLNVFKKLSGIVAPGVYHSDELGYLFKSRFTPGIDSGSIEDLAQRRFTRLWANFARCGDPTPDPQIDDVLLNVLWKRVEMNKMHFLEIGETLVMQADPEPERIAFWNDIFNTYFTMA